MSAEDTPAHPADRGDRPRETPGRRAVHEVIHAWIPLAIAFASVFAAIMGWQASLADESSAHKDELSRQDLVHQQQLLVQDNNAVETDVRTFGQFAQYSGLAHSLLHDAAHVNGQIGDQWRVESQSDLGIARYLGRQIQYANYAFDPSNPNGNTNLRSDGTYAPGHPYSASLALDVAENQDTALHGLEPEKLHEAAESTHTKGVRLTGIAALFISVMVLMTIAAIVSGPPKLMLAGSGAAVAVLGIILFAIVEAS
jgi:hypothetical protein